MDGGLSQDEINALLNGIDSGSDSGGGAVLTESEKDVLGEVSNISMGSAATALFTLLNQRVNITTPQVSYTTWDELITNYPAPCVFVQISYREGIEGSNVFILQEKDVKIIADLMMGGDGTNIGSELSELHLSAISEAMNQMMGSSSTSLSSILETKIDISPPLASVVNLTDAIKENDVGKFLQGTFVKVSFSLEVGDLINSELMQLYPLDFAKDLHAKFMKYAGIDANDDFGNISANDLPPAAAPAPEPAPQPAPQVQQPQMAQQPQMMQQPQMAPQMMQQPMMQPQMMQQPMYAMPPVQDVNISPVQFQPFVAASPLLQTENIDLLLDVPLEVTAELGRTSKSIKEILDFSPGTIIELNRLAGEPIDVLINGKFVAKGEVCVIEETFAIKVTEVVK
jgi:flagellar motor switch protein FliN/FliY